MCDYLILVSKSCSIKHDFLPPVLLPVHTRTKLAREHHVITKPKWPGLALYNLPLCTMYVIIFVIWIWFIFFSYRILGLCNNFAYVIMLSAAHDILKDQEQKDHVESHNVIIYNNRKLLIENFNDQWMTFEMVTFGSGPFKNWTGKKIDKIWQMIA